MGEQNIDVTMTLACWILQVKLIKEASLELVPEKTGQQHHGTCMVEALLWPEYEQSGKGKVKETFRRYETTVFRKIER